MKPIFENEKEIRTFLQDVSYSIAGQDLRINIGGAIEKSKSLGYIKKSELEIAKENWYNVNNTLEQNYHFADIYITALEKELNKNKEHEYER